MKFKAKRTLQARQIFQMNHISRINLPYTYKIQISSQGQDIDMEFATNSMEHFLLHMSVTLSLSYYTGFIFIPVSEGLSGSVDQL